MKKLILVALMTLLFCGCSMTGTPSIKVSEYLSKFNSLDELVIQDMESTIQGENLSVENTTIYRNVLQRQYQDLKYDIVEESINGDNAVVIAKITVYDLHASKMNSETYMNEHQDEFLDVDNMFDQENYMKYRLENMLSTKDTVSHNISFNLTKKDDEWVIDEIDRVTLEKIHGLYFENQD